jgi:hypothetical protein
MAMLGEIDRPTRLALPHLIQQGSEQKIIASLGDAIWNDLANQTLMCALNDPASQLLRVQQYLAANED